MDIFSNIHLLKYTQIQIYIYLNVHEISQLCMLRHIGSMACVPKTGNSLGDQSVHIPYMEHIGISKWVVIMKESSSCNFPSQTRLIKFGAFPLRRSHFQRNGSLKDWFWFVNIAKLQFYCGYIQSWLGFLINLQPAKPHVKTCYNRLNTML